MTLMSYIYRASMGETWDGITLYLFGDEGYADELMEANPLLIDRMVMKGGETLNIPEIESLPTDDSSEASAFYTAPWKK